MNSYIPTAEDKFSFGLWTVGWRGVDVFGGAVRDPLDPIEAVDKLAELGAAALTFHDDDLVPDDATAGRPSTGSARRSQTQGCGSRWRPPTCSGTPCSRRGHLPQTIAMCAATPWRRCCATSTWRLSWVPVPTYCGAVARAPSRARARTSQPPWTATRSPSTCCARTCGTRGTTSGSRSSPSRTSHAATSCCQLSGTRSRLSPSSTSRAGWAQPRGRPRGDGWAQLRARDLAGAVARQALPYRPQRAARAAIRPGPSLRRRQPARRLLGGRCPARRGQRATYDGYVHFDYKPPRTEDMDGVWETARACMRNYLILREKVRAFRADPAVHEALTVAEVDRLVEPTLGPSESLADLRSAPYDVDRLAARGCNFERLDQLAIEHLLGVR